MHSSLFLPENGTTPHNSLSLGELNAAITSKHASIVMWLLMTLFTNLLCLSSSESHYSSDAFSYGLFTDNGKGLDVPSTSQVANKRRHTYTQHKGNVVNVNICSGLPTHACGTGYSGPPHI